MIFVLIGFQHFVANMFIIPAGIWAGANVSWGQFFYNMIPVFLGNVLGGSSFVAASYLFAYKHLLKDDFSIWCSLFSKNPVSARHRYGVSAQGRLKVQVV